MSLRGENYYMKKIKFLCIALLIIMLTGCSDSDKVTLNVFNWGEYIDIEVLKTFEEETGIKINYETYETNEDMYQKIKNGGSSYDVIFPSDYMVQKMIDNDLLQEIDLNNITNYKYIEDKFKNLDYDIENKYSVPYFWGTVGILYNTTMVDETVDSWDILWNEKYSQSILMQNSVRDAFAVALKKLGYSINTTDTKELDEAKQLLIDQKPMVLAYVIDEARDKMIGNEAALAVIYSGEAVITKESNPDLEYVVPCEGSNIWFDAIAIPKSAKHIKEAEMFIDFLTRPDIAYKITEYVGYSTPSSGVKDLMSKEELSNKGNYPDEETINKCEVFRDLGENNRLYEDRWTEVKAK